MESSSVPLGLSPGSRINRNFLGYLRSREGARPVHQQRRENLAGQAEEGRGHQGLLDYGSSDRLDPGTVKIFPATVSDLG